MKHKQIIGHLNNLLFDEVSSPLKRRLCGEIQLELSRQLYFKLLNRVWNDLRRNARNQLYET